MTPDRIYSVTQLSKSIRNLFAKVDLSGKLIEGEISGWKIYSSGHAYFTLKDATAQITCVLFEPLLYACQKNDAVFREKCESGAGALNGLKVDVGGELAFQPARGSYNLKVTRLKLAGLGDRMAQFNALKKKLTDEGLIKFGTDKCRPLPFLPGRIAIVTSSAGAVIHDMCTVLTRRFPDLEIRLYPVRVQGDGAAEDIAGGISWFNRTDTGWTPDVLIVGRGGGSVEDLWAFNEEAVARAVASSRIPVISAVGHETDFTLCDFVADRRAGTPSIAAEMAVPVKSELFGRVEVLRGRLRHALDASAESAAMRLDACDDRLGSTLRAAADRFDLRFRSATARLTPALKESASAASTRLAASSLRLRPAMESALQRADHALKEAARGLTLLDPYAVLGRGYSITTDADGKVLRAVSAAEPGTRIMTRLADGSFTSVVSDAV